jgi:NAD(P)-dependent dehydrogenase (short-subunit alcohol dehydrogenase family)
MALSGSHVFITGALGTLGQAQARKLAAAGATLTLVDLPNKQAEGADFAATLPHASYQGIDLNDLQGLSAAISDLTANSPVDVLINNAAMIINRPFEQFTIAEYEDQVRVNSSAAFVLTQGVAAGMKAKRYGKIINFCSLTLNGRWDGYVPYVASKGALLGLTKTLARELGEFGIRVNAVSPGAVVSEAEARVFADKLQQYNDWIIENQCLKVRIQPDHVADLVMFLASPASDLITSQNIHIDGGW